MSIGLISSALPIARVRAFGSTDAQKVPDPVSSAPDYDAMMTRIEWLKHCMCNCEDAHLGEEDLMVNKLSQISYGVKIIEFIVIATAAEILSGKFVHWGSDILHSLQRDNKLPSRLKGINFNKPKTKHRVLFVSLRQIISFALALLLTRFVIREAEHYADHKLKHYQEYSA